MIILLIVCVCLLTAAQCAQAFVIYALYQRWKNAPLLPAPVTDFVNAPWRQEPDVYA